MNAPDIFHNLERISCVNSGTWDRGGSLSIQRGSIGVGAGKIPWAMARATAARPQVVVVNSWMCGGPRLTLSGRIKPLTTRLQAASWFWTYAPDSQRTSVSRSALVIVTVPSM